MTIEKSYVFACLILLPVLAPSCATSGNGAPIFFGRAPMGDVDARPIDKVRLEAAKPSTNFSGRNTESHLSYSGVSVPDRWPVDNEHEVLSGFGTRGRRGHFHAGFDIRAAMRTPVHATADGVVVESNGGGAYGKKIIINHGNGLETTYAHLDERQADVGQKVHRGEQIALSGQSGNASTPHIHYEVHKDGRAVNPGGFLPGRAKN